MLLIYAGSYSEDFAKLLANKSLKYRKIGEVFLIDGSEEDILDALYDAEEHLLKEIKLTFAKPEELKDPKLLLNLGFKSIGFKDFVETKIFTDLSKILGEAQTFFHAIVSTKTKKVFGFEALCRTKIPVWKLFQMSDRVAFISDYYCREKALLEFKARFFGNYKLFLNFHPKFLKDPLENAGELEATLRIKGIDPHLIVVEIDEYDGMDIKALKMIRSFLKSAGISVALDDVGAGYAGLYQLVEINPDIAKLDMNLVRDVHKDRLKQSILKALVQACKDAGIRVLAEGVEKREELEFFLELDVDFIQGFIFSKPDPYPKIRQIEELAYNSISSY